MHGVRAMCFSAYGVIDKKKARARHDGSRESGYEVEYSSSSFEGKAYHGIYPNSRRPSI